MWGLRQQYALRSTCYIVLKLSGFDVFVNCMAIFDVAVHALKTKVVGLLVLIKPINNGQSNPVMMCFVVV